MASQEKLSNVSIESSRPLNSLQANSVGRRELLKVLASGSGVIALSPLLPNAWTQPVIETGFLPNHAQTSALTIANLQVEGPLSNIQ